MKFRIVKTAYKFNPEMKYKYWPFWFQMGSRFPAYSLKDAHDVIDRYKEFLERENFKDVVVHEVDYDG